MKKFLFGKLFYLALFSMFLLLFSCKKKADAPVPIIVPGTISASYVSSTTTQLKFRIRFFILDSRLDDNLSEIDIQHYLYIDDHSYAGVNYSYTLNSVYHVTTPFLGNSSTAVMLDESAINETDFNGLGAKYMLNQETTCRKFFKLTPSGSDFILAAYSYNNSFLPSQPLTIYGDGYTNQAELYDQKLAELRNYNYFTGNSPFLLALDSMLEYVNAKAPNTNKQIIAFTHNKDDVGGPAWNAVINKAVNYHIPVNIVMTYQSEGDFFNYISLAGTTGGLIFFVSNNQDGTNMPHFATRLNDILKGNFTCFESDWTVNASSPVFNSGFTESGYMQLYIDNKDKLYTYMPYFCRIP